MESDPGLAVEDVNFGEEQVRLGFGANTGEVSRDLKAAAGQNS
jgi:hypothetical protein